MKNNLQVITLLESKKSTYTAYAIVENTTDKESWEIRQRVYHLALSSWTTNEWVEKIFNFCKKFWIFQNSDVVWIKICYLDEEKKNDILNF